VGKTPLHPEDPRIVAIASDEDFPGAGIPRVDINDIEAIAEMVLARAEPLEKVIATLEG
jgi:molybdopterin-guanine dinucleotide biosynthesis protein B